MKAQEVHINMVRQYRCAQTRMNHMSEDATKPGRQDNYDEFIKVDIDACDEAKFKCPRNVSNAKSLERLWRPQLHLHGSLIWGVSELIISLMFWGDLCWDLPVFLLAIVMPFPDKDLSESQVAECFYVMEADMPKDASTEGSILCKALDDAAEILRQRSTAMPGNIILEAWEQKHASVLYSMLVWSFNQTLVNQMHP